MTFPAQVQKVFERCPGVGTSGLHPTPIRHKRITQTQNILKGAHNRSISMLQERLMLNVDNRRQEVLMEGETVECLH